MLFWGPDPKLSPSDLGFTGGPIICHTWVISYRLAGSASRSSSMFGRLEIKIFFFISSRGWRMKMDLNGLFRVLPVFFSVLLLIGTGTFLYKNLAIFLFGLTWRIPGPDLHENWNFDLNCLGWLNCCEDAKFFLQLLSWSCPFQMANKFADHSFMDRSIDTNFDPPQFSLDSFTFFPPPYFAPSFEVWDIYSQSNKLTRVCSALSFIGGDHIGARALLDTTRYIDMVWLYDSPIPVGRRGVIYLFKGFLPAATCLEKGGRGSAPCAFTLLKTNGICVHWLPPNRIISLKCRQTSEVEVE